MNIILGASGQIGSLIVKHLRDTAQPVMAVVRKKEVHDNYVHSGIQSYIADLHDAKSLEGAFKNGHTLFVLTPETPSSANIVEDTKRILENIKQAVRSSTIKRIVGLSSFGAQHPSGTGNLALSYLLEHAFDDLRIEKIFIRPAYYYSNWLGYFESIEQTGVLPTLFPTDLKIPMTAPTDVANCISDAVTKSSVTKSVIEIMGPKLYSSNDIAGIFEKVLNKKVSAITIPEKEWKKLFLQFGATDNYADSLTEMTKAVIKGKARPEKPNEVMLQKTGFEKFLKESINKKLAQAKAS